MKLFFNEIAIAQELNGPTSDQDLENTSEEEPQDLAKAQQARVRIYHGHLLESKRVCWDVGQRWHRQRC